MAKGRVHSRSICWGCEKACGKCSWSGLPQREVEGSKVVYYEQLYRSNGKVIGTIRLGRVLYCPEFKEG